MTNETLKSIYSELKQTRDEIGLKLHLGGMELRDQWGELDAEWNTWTDHVAKELKTKAEDLEAKIREAGGEDLRKAEIATKLSISKLQKGFKEVSDKLKEKEE